MKVSVETRSSVVAAAMITTAALAAGLTPTKRVADERPQFNLETLIPVTIGEWRHVPGLIPVVAGDAEIERTVARIYSQVLMRTYRNNSGDHVMLAIAYGGGQTDELQLHRPEVCYVFQGFRILSSFKDRLAMGTRYIPVKRLVAVNATRSEPITYWITIGDRAVADGMARKIAQVRYGLTGLIPDGMLVRVSMITKDAETAFRLHDRFVLDLLAEVGVEGRTRLLGGPPLS